MISADTDLNYVERSTTALIHVGKDSYFDNMTILEQFERLFQLLQYKEEYKGHRIERIVDNARSHTVKSIGTRCPIDKIEYVDSKGTSQTLHCYFQSGPNQGKSKGLLAIAKELELVIPSTIKLVDLQKMLANHPAFQIVRYQLFQKLRKECYFSIALGYTVGATSTKLWCDYPVLSEASLRIKLH